MPTATAEDLALLQTRGVFSPIPGVTLVVLERAGAVPWYPILRTVADHLGAGVTAVIYLDDIQRAVAVYSELWGIRLFNIHDTVAIPEILPGFAFPVATLFA